MDKDEIISAFAFKTGKEIERVINSEIKNTLYENQMMKARILEFYHILQNGCGISDESAILINYKEHFNLNTTRNGKKH